ENNDRIRNLKLPDREAFPLKTILQDSGGTLWCLTVSGKVWQRDTVGHWKEWSIPEVITAIAPDRNGICLTGESSLFRIIWPGGLRRLSSTGHRVKKVLVAAGKIWLLPE